jgi:hypothetical protein
MLFVYQGCFIVAGNSPSPVGAVVPSERSYRRSKKSIGSVMKPGTQDACDPRKAVTGRRSQEGGHRKAHSLRRSGRTVAPDVDLKNQ